MLRAVLVSTRDILSMFSGMVIGMMDKYMVGAFRFIIGWF